MSLRDTINNNSAIVAVAAITLLVLVLGWLIWGGLGGGGGSGGYVSPTGKWFYAMESGKIFKGEYDQVAPFEAPSGGEAVEIIILSCDSSCGGHDLEGKTPDELESLGLMASHLMKLSPKGKRAYDKADPAERDYFAMEMFGDMYLIRAMNEERWYSSDSEKLYKINQQMASKCPKDKYPRQCYPGQ